VRRVDDGEAELTGTVDGARSSMVVMVPVLWVRERLWALVKLWYLCTGREEG
jgi:hypothetical protein